MMIQKVDYHCNNPHNFNLKPTHYHKKISIVKEINQKNEQLDNQLTDISLETYDNAIFNAKDELSKIEKDIHKLSIIIANPNLPAKQDGVVKEVLINQGANITKGQSLISLSDETVKVISVQVSQEDINTIEVDQLVEIQFLAQPDTTVNGKVKSINGVGQSGSDGITYEVMIDFDDSKIALKQGMTCSVKFIIKRVDDVLTLNNKAIRNDNGKQYVKIKDENNQIIEQEITTGFSDGRVSEIKSGLKEGDVVLVEG